MFYRSAVAALLLASSPAFAAATIDQSNVNVFTGAPGTTVGASPFQSRPDLPAAQRWQAQTIVAGLTGKLTAVDLQVFHTSGIGALLVTLGTGELTFPGYASVGTIAVPQSNVASSAAIASGGFTTVDLSSLNYFVTAGQTFTLTLAAATPGPGQDGNFFGWAFGETDLAGNLITTASYAPGVARLSSDSGQSWGIVGLDRGFRTFVDVAPVPEPSTWAMLIVGFAIVGGAARRRRAVATA